MNGNIIKRSDAIYHYVIKENWHNYHNILIVGYIPLYGNGNIFFCTYINLIYFYGYILLWIYSFTDIFFLDICYIGYILHWIYSFKDISLWRIYFFLDIPFWDFNISFLDTLDGDISKLSSIYLFRKYPQIDISFYGYIRKIYLFTDIYEKWMDISIKRYFEYIQNRYISKIYRKYIHKWYIS